MADRSLWGVLAVWIGAGPRIGPRGRQEPQDGPEGGRPWKAAPEAVETGGPSPAHQKRALECVQKPR